LAYSNYNDYIFFISCLLSITGIFCNKFK
jgi:hypothetical protein